MGAAEDEYRALPLARRMELNGRTAFIGGFAVMSGRAATANEAVVAAHVGR